MLLISFGNLDLYVHLVDDSWTGFRLLGTFPPFEQNNILTRITTAARRTRKRAGDPNEMILLRTQRLIAGGVDEEWGRVLADRLVNDASQARRGTIIASMTLGLGGGTCVLKLLERLDNAGTHEGNRPATQLAS